MKRFPIGLTVAAAIGLAILLGLGFWQLKRLAWKRDLLARVAELKHAAPRPAGPVLADAAKGVDVGYARIAATCAPARRTPPATYRYALRDGRVGWRLLTFCPLSAGPYAGIVLDRGLVTRFTGQMSPSAASFPVPVGVTGILRAPGKPTFLDTAPATIQGGAVVLQSVDQVALEAVAARDGASGVAPYYLAVESENPAPAGVTPAALPGDIPNNHFVYALTWFGLAAGLVWTWAAYVWRRMRGP